VQAELFQRDEALGKASGAAEEARAEGQREARLWRDKAEALEADLARLWQEVKRVHEERTRRAGGSRCT
jgi:hypothetical protein